MIYCRIFSMRLTRFMGSRPFPDWVVYAVRRATLAEINDKWYGE